ncbi:MAG: TolC family protein [Candidatus Margulisbacteria bacterium]|nr:TolC family protein [Candidatus Margulisiibacteriota bacterium]MBU1022201.1 TolC family protein [Candidatus Margulisiibacteriota bacterium]MBU1729360.1 TolC family protein [Candidatus Margulisiibacteriota bacterium]MBU1955633.1 TolC family protein [Candidatus Margulisiibacteriota bacterium]
MNKLIITLVLCILVLSSQVWAENTLTQTAFINEAISRNPSYQISAQEYLIALESDKSVRSLEDWNLVVAGIWDEATPAPISTLSANYQRTMGYSVGLEKYIANSGTAIQIEHSNTRIDSQYPPPITIPGIGTLDFNPPAKYYLSSISVTIVQPLLKNAFGLATKNALKMSDYSLKLAKIKLSEDWEDFISLLRGEYLIWQKCNKNVEYVKKQVETAEDQLTLTQKQQKYGLSEDLDVVQVQQKLEAYKILLAQAKLACDTQTQKVSLLMGHAEVSIEAIKPEAFTPNEAGMDEITAGAYLVSLSNVKKTADILVELQDINLETKENAQLMDVSLVLSAQPNAYSEKFSETYSTLGEYRNNSFTITASRPLANDEADAEAAKAKAEYKKAQAEKEEILLSAKIGLSALYNNLNRLTEMVQLNENNLKLAQQRLTLEKKKFNQGRSSVFFVLQAEDDLLKAENNLNETVFAREEIINQIKTLTDQYLVEYKDVLKL